MPSSEQHAERAPQVQRPAGDPQREQRERHRDRQHQHDHDRLDEALELRRQHHVDEDHRQRRSPGSGWSSSRRGSSTGPACRNDIVGGRLSAGEHARGCRSTPRRARGPGATLGVSMHRELTVRSLQRARAEAALRSRAMLSMRTGPVGDGTVSRPISAASRRWFSSTRDLDRDTAPALPCRTKSRSSPDDGEAERVADGRHAHAEVGGPPPIHRDVDLRVRDAEAQLRLGEARRLLRRRRAPSSSSRSTCAQVGPEDVGRDGEAAGCPSPLPSALRDDDARPVGRMLRQPACASPLIICALRSACGPRPAAPGR